ncbi:MAG TPA: cytochrome c oxidase subunit 3 family protein [Terriglobales bacterium]|nr:cytochrome c oxidase subunit 3 family protein [Terriglobales bacterium]
MAANTEVVAQQALRHHFATMQQQRDSATLGMWIFLVTEILFFGGLFTAYLVYRTMHYPAWEMGSEHMSFVLGTTNTVILLTSSLTVALGVHAAQVGKPKVTAILLLITILMGFGFLGIKGMEYHEHYVHGLVPGPFWHFNHVDAHGNVPPNELQLFFYLYFVMTGLHALHVIIGLGILSVIAFFAWRGRYTPQYHTPVHIAGLYWHFVDLVWIFLYPLLYLIAHTHV